MRRRKRKRKLKQPIICCRVSTYPQVRNGNLEDQSNDLKRESTRRYGGYVRVFSKVGQGNRVERWEAAAKLARKLDVPIFAESLDRLMRSSNYDIHQNAPLTDEDQERYDRVFEGVEILFLYSARVRSHQTKRGGAGRPIGRKKVGRPRGRKNVSQSILQRARYLRSQGLSYGGISQIMDRSRQTIYYWINDKDEVSK